MGQASSADDCTQLTRLTKTPDKWLTTLNFSDTKPEHHVMNGQHKLGFTILKMSEYIRVLPR